MVTDFLDNTQQRLLILALLRHYVKASFISLSYTYSYVHVCMYVVYIIS